MKIKALFLLASVCLISVGAAAQSNTELWKGRGMVFTPTGRSVARYNVEIELVKSATGSQSKITYFYADGKTKVVSQRIVASGQGTSFFVESDLGKGTGACFDSNVCQLFVSNGRGHTYATFTAQEKNHLTHLTTEYEGKTAVNIFRQELDRVR